MNLNESVIRIRVDLQNSAIKKSGKNAHAGFKYYELKDFLPKLNELMLENGVNDILMIDSNLATLTLVKGEEREIYSMPFVLFETPLSKAGNKTMQDIQYLGALNTYYKRYLYLNAFGITDGEVIDSMEATYPKKNVPQQEALNMTLPQKDKIIKLIQDGKIELERVKAYYKIASVDELNHLQAETVIKQGNKK